MKPTTQTLVRVALLALTLVNMAVSTLGLIPEELNTQTYQTISYVLAAVMALRNMWKNNSFTPEAIQADQFLAKLREEAAKKAEDTNA